MGINDRDYMRRRPEESKLEQAKSAISGFYERHPTLTLVLIAGAIAFVVLLIKG